MMTTFNQQAGGQLDADAIARRLNVLEALGAGDYLGAYAWASLPAAASYAGYRARVTDYGVNLIVISDGTRWVPAGPQVLARSGVAVSNTGTTSGVTAASIVVPAGILGVNGALRITSNWSTTNNGNAKTAYIVVAGSNFMVAALASIASFSDVRKVTNRNSAASQVGSAAAAANAFGTNGGAVVTSAIDFSVAQTLTLQYQLGVGTDTITLESYTVEVLP